MKTRFSIFVCGALLSSQAWAGCTAPAAPASMPNGKTAAKEAMMATKKEVDRYKKEVEAYLSCESNAKFAESAQAELERVANRFNAEVRAFKAANTQS